MTKIIGFSGKAQAGKDSACNLLYCIALRNVLKLTEVAYVDDDGKVVIEYTDENGKFDGPLSVDSRHPEIMAWMAQFVWPFIKKFSYAEPLKEFCQYVLGLPEEGVWGTNEQKNQPTHLKWEDMPVPINVYKKNGPMTNREVMEYFGSQICRKMYPNVWADALIRKIELMKPEIAVVCDVRFPNEVDAIKKAGGKVIRLTRTIEESANNKHISNTALDQDVYDWSNFDAVIDNQNLTIREAQDLILAHLVDFDIMKLEEVGV